MCAARYTVGSALECLQRTRKDEDWKERKKDINGERKKEKEEKKQQTSGTIVYCSTACYYEGHRDGPRVHWFLSVHCPPPFTYYDISLSKKNICTILNHT